MDIIKCTDMVTKTIGVVLWSLSWLIAAKIDSINSEIIGQKFTKFGNNVA